MDIIGKLRKPLIPFIIVISLFIIIFGYVLTIVKDFFVKNRFEIIMALSTGLFVVPIVYSVIRMDWQIPGILIFYDFIFGVVVLIMLFNSADEKRYYGDGYNGPRGYNDTPYRESRNYTNSYYNPLSFEKRRNGGLTDKEVSERKQQIRKKLENKKILKPTKEEVTSE